MYTYLAAAGLIYCSQKGAGVGGVGAAARLAKAGFKVSVFEKNDFTGGRCSLIHHEGYVRMLENKIYLLCSLSFPSLPSPGFFFVVSRPAFEKKKKKEKTKN